MAGLVGALTSALQNQRWRRQWPAMEHAERRNEHCWTDPLPVQAEPLGVGHLRAGIEIWRYQLRNARAIYP